jgi:hypothetical protein
LSYRVHKEGHAIARPFAFAAASAFAFAVALLVVIPVGNLLLSLKRPQNPDSRDFPH